eukprot:762148-Hanusia_phi.AAC.1
MSPVLHRNFNSQEIHSKLSTLINHLPTIFITLLPPVCLFLLLPFCSSPAAPPPLPPPLPPPPPSFQAFRRHHHLIRLGFSSNPRSFARSISLVEPACLSDPRGPLNTTPSSWSSESENPVS